MGCVVSSFEDDFENSLVGLAVASAVCCEAEFDNSQVGAGAGATESVDLANSEGDGVAATVLGDSGSVACASSESLSSSDCGISHNSLHYHTIHAHAPSRLASASCGLGVVAGFWVRAGVGCVVDDGDDACMDVPNSRIQGFTEYHDDSCALLIRAWSVVIKTGEKQSVQVRVLCARPGGLLRESLLVLSGDETWAGCNESLRLTISQAEEIQMKCVCAVSVLSPRPSFSTPALPGPGSEIRRMMGWTQVGNTGRSGLWWFPGALKRKDICPVLSAAVDWVRKESYHTAWSLPCDSSCTCSYAYGRGPAIGPHTGRRCWPLLAGVWRAIAPLMKPWCAEGDVPAAANLKLYRGWNSRVGWHCDDDTIWEVWGGEAYCTAGNSYKFLLFLGHKGVSVTAIYCFRDTQV